MNTKRFIFFLFLIGVVYPHTQLASQTPSFRTQEGLNLPLVDVQVRAPNSNQEVALSVQLLLFLTIIALAPSILVLMTSFLRISIVLDFVKRALSLQQVPPNQVLMGISLFLTLFVMWPVFTKIYNEAFIPFSEGEIAIQEMYDKAEGPLRIFMFRQMEGNSHQEIQLFMRMSNLPQPQNFSQVPTYVLIPAFVLHEMTIAFKMGILIFLPFIIIDMVVSSALMSMGMIMLPPVMISSPFKLMLFVLVDGWGLLTQQLVRSFL